MDKEQFPEWRVLADRAADRLRQGSYNYKKTHKRAFQLVITPRFSSPQMCWECCSRELEGEKGYYALFTCWKVEVDFLKLESPVERVKYPVNLEASIQVQEVELEREFACSILYGLKNLSVPVYIVNERFFLDAASYDFSYRSYGVEAGFS